MRDQKILSWLSSRSAIILAEMQGGVATYAAYPYGDRRRRPVSWIEAPMFKRFVSDGILIETKKGYEIVPSAARRATSSASDSAHARQHREMEAQNFSHGDGSFRCAQVNRNSRNVLRILAGRLDSHGKAFLSGPEIMAGEQLSNDYARAGIGQSVTQNFMNAGGGSAGGNGAENSTIASLDARKRFNDALAHVGPGLDRAVMAICCKDMGLGELELAEGWAKRSGKTVLKLGLQRLAEFYGTEVGSYRPVRARASF
jgi:hypothetical protein